MIYFKAVNHECNLHDEFLSKNTKEALDAFYDYMDLDSIVEDYGYSTQEMKKFDEALVKLINNGGLKITDTMTGNHYVIMINEDLKDNEPQHSFDLEAEMEDMIDNLF